MCFVRIAVVTGKADIDVPAGVAGISGMREAHSRRSEPIARLPSSFSDQAIESLMEHSRVRRLLKGSAAVARQPDDRLRPRRGIMPIEGDVSPHDVVAFLSHFPRESAIDADEPFSHKLLYLRVRRCPRARMTMISHNFSLSPTSAATPSALLRRELLRFYKEIESRGVTGPTRDIATIRLTAVQRSLTEPGCLSLTFGQEQS